MGLRAGGCPGCSVARLQGVVPVAVEAVPGDRHSGEYLVADLDAGGVLAGVELGADAQGGAGGSRRNALDDDFVAGQWPAAPVHGDVGEQAMLDPVPFRGAGTMPLLELLKQCWMRVMVLAGALRVGLSCWPLAR